MAKDYFWRSKLSIVLSILFSICGFFFFEEISAIELGFLVGVAAATSLSALPSKSLHICIPVQIVLIALLALGICVWWMFLALFIMLFVAMVWAKDTGRLNVLVTYFLVIILPLAGIVLAKLFTLGCG